MFETNATPRIQTNVRVYSPSMTQPESSACQLCWIQTEFGNQTICRSLEEKPCTVADLGSVPMPASIEKLRERLAGVSDAILQEEGPTQAVVVCTFPRKKNSLELELGAIGRHKPGWRSFTFPDTVAQ